MFHPLRFEIYPIFTHIQWINKIFTKFVIFTIKKLKLNYCICKTNKELCYKNKYTMNDVATDNSNPNWIRLETILKSVSNVIFEIAEFYIDKKNSQCCKTTEDCYPKQH